MIVRAPEHPHLIYEIIDLFLHEPHYYTFEELVNLLKLNEYDADFVFNSMVSAQPDTSNPNHLLVLVNKTVNGIFYEDDGKKWVYGLLPNAITSFVDYEEIKEARKSAQEAKRQSAQAQKLAMTALIVSSILGVIQIGLTIYYAR